MAPKKEYKKLTFETKEEWLNKRDYEKRIGGTSASALFGENNHKTALSLFSQLKFGNNQKNLCFENDSKLSLNEYDPIKYGIKMEPLIRSIAYYNLLQNGLVVKNENINLYISTKNNYQSASIDGSVVVKGENPYGLKINDHGILEIKTCDIRNREDLEKWSNQIPQNYYIQVLHYLCVLNDFTFAYLIAKLRFFEFNSTNKRVFSREEIRYYLIKREDVLEDIKILENKEKQFIEEYIIGNKIPKF